MKWTSVGSAGDMPRTDTQLGDYESAMEGMTLDLVSLTRIREQDAEEMEKNPEVETGEDGIDKE